MSASKELIRCVFDFVEEGEDEEAEPVETPEEREERLQREEIERQHKENIEFSLHGPDVLRRPIPMPGPARVRTGITTARGTI